MSSATGDVPPRLEGGAVPQELVRFLGERRGRTTIRGRASGRTYAYDADYPLFWVLAEDLAQLVSRSEFVLEPGDVRNTGPAVAALEEVPSNEDRQVHNKGGRPRTATHELQMVWHLRFHEGPRTNADVGRLAFGPRLGQYRQPASAISQRLRAVRQRVADPDTGCPFCT